VKFDTRNNVIRDDKFKGINITARREKLNKLEIYKKNEDETCISKLIRMAENLNIIMKELY
jgi:hypothetical protein